MCLGVLTFVSNWMVSLVNNNHAKSITALVFGHAFLRCVVIPHLLFMQNSVNTAYINATHLNQSG